MQRQVDHAAEGLTCAIILLLSASGAIGASLEAIRIHPAYGKEMPWLRTGMNLSDQSYRDEVARILEAVGKE